MTKKIFNCKFSIIDFDSFREIEIWSTKTSFCFSRENFYRVVFLPFVVVHLTLWGCQRSNFLQSDENKIKTKKLIKTFTPKVEKLCNRKQQYIFFKGIYFSFWRPKNSNHRDRMLCRCCYSRHRSAGWRPTNHQPTNQRLGVEAAL